MADLTDAALVAAACERLGIRPHALGITPLDHNFAARCVAAVGERKAWVEFWDAIRLAVPLHTSCGTLSYHEARRGYDLAAATPRQLVQACLAATEGRQ